MSVIALCERGLVVGMHTEDEVTYPSEGYSYANGIIFSYMHKVLTFYDKNKKQVVKEHIIPENCKQVQISECGRLGGALTFEKNLFILSHTGLLLSYGNVNMFSMSSSILCFSTASVLFIKELTSEETKKFENVFYFKAFGNFAVIVQRIKDKTYNFELSVYRREVVFSTKLEQMEKIEAKSDYKGSFLFLVTSKYMSSSYYGHEHLYFFNLRSLMFKEVDVLDPPLFFSFLESSFVVCSGNQPSLVSVYDYKCCVINTFPKGIRNRVFFNPHYNLVAFCGFDNLSGNVEIYDVQTLKIVSKLKALGASLFCWSPSGSYFKISVTNSMREGNNISIYDYYGRRIGKSEFRSLIRSEWVGDKEDFVRLERPESLQIEEESTYVLPSFDAVKLRLLQKKKHVIQAKPNTKDKIKHPEKAERSICDVKNDLEDIRLIKEKQEKGINLSVNELNKLLRENSLVKELKRLETE